MGLPVPPWFLKGIIAASVVAILILGSVLTVRLLGEPIDEIPPADIAPSSPMGSPQSPQTVSPYPTLGPEGGKAGERRSAPPPGHSRTTAPGIAYPDCPTMLLIDPDGAFEGEPGYALKLDRDRDGHACDTDGDLPGAPTTEPATGISPSPSPTEPVTGTKPSPTLPPRITQTPTTVAPAPIISIEIEH